MNNVPGAREALDGDGLIRPVVSAYGGPAILEVEPSEAGSADPICVDLVDHRAALTIAGRPHIRPFGFEATQDEASMLGIDSRHQVVRIPLQEIAGLSLRGRLADDSAERGFRPLVSLAYERGGNDGSGPVDPIVALEGVGLSVSGYLGWRQTWYFRGVRAGEFNPATGETAYLSFDERARLSPENFLAPLLSLVRSVRLEDSLADPRRLQATV